MRWFVRGMPLAAMSVLLIGGANAADPPTLVLLGGNIVTMEDVPQRAEALAVRDQRIIALGTNAEIRKLIAPTTEVIDLTGRLVLPGFIEGHGHFLSLGQAKQRVDLSKAKSWDEIVHLVAQEAKRQPEGTWILGRGWHQEKWQAKPKSHVDGYPPHEELSRVTPEHPVLLVHGTGHAAIANQNAMKLAGVDAKTPDPTGGKILRNARGQAIGVFRETAQSLIHRTYEKAAANRSEEEQQAELVEAIPLAGEECLSKGITSFQDAGSSFSEVDLFQEVADKGRLPVRLWVMLRSSPAEYREKLGKYRRVDVAQNFLTVRAIKCMADGALGSHGALLFEPYLDVPESTGLRVQSLGTIEETALLAVKHDYQLCTHAIGDRANREILDLYEKIIKSHPQKSDWRWRIEHAQHIHLMDIPRFGDLGILASMQAVHATSDGPFVVPRLGEQRAKHGAYVWRSLLDTNARIINGTDAPVEDVSPLASYYASITRKMADGKPFYPEQCMTRMEALKSYTIDAAYGAFEDHQKGSLKAGKLADITVLSQDILTIPAEEILKTEVDLTIVGGKVAYDRLGAAEKPYRIKNSR